MKVAIVCDWLATVGGAEKTLAQMLECFPDADLFSIVDFLKDEDRHLIKHKKVTTSYIQKLPFARKKFRNYLLFMPFAIEQFNFGAYDIVISSSHAVAKGIITGINQLHICYCHSPIRYAWDQQETYLQGVGLSRGLKSFFVRYLLHKVRAWDVISSSRPDYMIANSHFIAKRISKYYRRDSEIIYPPVYTEMKCAIDDKPDEGYFLTASRIVPYKKIDLIVRAFLQTPSRKLIIIGDGADRGKIQQLIGSADNIKLLGYKADEVLYSYLSNAIAFIFAAEEDFGILPVEAQACGTPVIAFAKGGVSESVIGVHDSPSEATGVFFHEQTTDSLLEAIQQFEIHVDKIKKDNCRLNAKRFSNDVFRQKFKQFVLNRYAEFQANI